MTWETLAPRTLDNEHVLLRPIRPEDRESLREIAMDAAIWRYFVVMIESDADFDKFFDAALDDTMEGRRVVFHITDKASGRAAGSMSYGNLAERDRRLEIGWSWLGRAFRGSGVNRWSKLLMLEHAFERLGCERVEFKTDVLNLQARRALLKIGATEEGVLRSYNVMPGGRRRDAIYYSVLRREWPQVKEALSLPPQALAAEQAA
jgi:RimJ/RimL family protein N-acetyltransferase